MLSQKDPYAKSDSIALAGKEFFAIHGSSSARSIDCCLLAILKYTTMHHKSCVE